MHVYMQCVAMYTSVLCIDLPIIVSGDRIACFEPQEVMWKGESGQSFKLPTLISQSSDFVAPLNGLAGFNSSTVRHSGYSQTLFRLPLRTQASGLSDNTYDTRKLLELLDALRQEARYLLLFLKSVCKIEVVQISRHGPHSTSFCVEIARASFDVVKAKRDSFMRQLRQAHAVQPYKISNAISFTVKFSVVVTDNNSRKNQAGTSNWLIANCVGSADPTVQAAAFQQRTFPWVGAVLELGGSSTGGRIFCFLPMPVETSSGLPIHVNGTFGLNDERRTLKWPGIERRNDPTANWNKTLVSQLLPPCYAMLLTEAKKHLSTDQFYKAWPDVNIVKRTQFSEILKPLFAALFRHAVVWTERTEALQQVGNWVLISQATFISEGRSLPSVMKKVLSSCGVQLVTIPAVMWRAIRFAKVGLTEVSPRLARSNMRSHPNSYTSVDQYGKRVILTYCLSDNCYSDLNRLNLLPLANGTFTSFDSYYGGQTVYLCSTDCPRSLLPNLDHLLVDLSDDQELQMNLYQVAASQQTRLRLLSDRDVAVLLTQAMPSNWKSSSLVTMPHSQLPSTWLQSFWSWLKSRRDLSFFKNQLLLPCYGSTSNSTSSFYLTRLSSAQPVVYVSSYTSCPSNLLPALYKMNVRVCLQSEFSLVQHKQLSKYVRYLDTNTVLDIIYSQSNYKKKFSTDEADSLRTFLISGSYTPTSSRKAVLQNLAIFSSASNSHSQLYSVSSASSQSVSRQALGEPSNCAINLSNLPPNLILFSRGNYHQLQLLQALQITFPTDYRLLLNYIFPLISNRTLSDNLTDSLMTEVLDMFQVLNSRERSSNLSSSLQSLSFVKTIHCRKSPAELFNPLSDEIAALYNGEDVFPQSPYNSYERIEVLKICGLCTSVTPQQVLNIIYSISSSANSYPQHVSSRNLSRAKAVLEYISKPSFHRQTSGNYTVPNTLGRYSFSDALRRLTSNRSWLPVLSDGPSGYCDELSWKGSGYSSHFISLSSSVVVLTSSTAHTLPHLVGSQVYFVTPTVSPQIAAMLPTDSASIAKLVVAHFREILANKDQISVEEMDSLIHRVYSYLNNTGTSALRQLYSIDEWIYIKREDKHVAPAVVALNQNSTFRQNLEPYIYILPDSLSRYKKLFRSGSGVNQAVSQDQIVSILASIEEEIGTGTQRTTAQEAWDMIMSILNWLTSNGNKKVDSSIDPHVPVETESEWPKLVTASEVVYTDNNFVKRFLQSSSEKDKYTFVHKCISPELAKALGVVPLTEFLDISEDTFEDAGQYEPLTTRLRNILRDYKDGLTIIKELLQNADDAEATEVNICYDTRPHEKASERLFFSGMAEAHGPALIVHNNKTFSDDDFSNITKLAAATKQGKVLKIGKFGIGFCSVYHMTDVPSFISRDKLYIFDPTLKHLGKEIKNPAQPGKKIVFTHKFISSSGQLSPYDGLFGFNRSEYEGTMFRLPFRTHASELSGTCYTEATVQELISAIKESSTNLLLFLQHVRTITFHRIDPGQTTPQVILKVRREQVSPRIDLSLPTGTEIRELSCTASADSNSCQWLVSQVKEDHLQKYYTASVACPLGSSDYKVNSNFEGEIFCFLPLSQRTGLPVHVSSNFAVINNRRGIWTSDEATSQTDQEVGWNVELMEGAIPRAYHSLLLALKEMAENKILPEYVFHCLWPREEDLLQHNPWECMMAELYSLISRDELFHSATNQQWLGLFDCKFLEPQIMCLSSDLTTPACVLTIVQHLNIPMVDLPQVYHSYFDLEDLTLGEKEFVELFFDNLDSLESILPERNEAIKCMLEQYMAKIDRASHEENLEYFFKHLPSIPCCPDGVKLRKCDEVIDPKSKFACLFDEEEARFPLELLTRRDLSSAALHKLGMLSDTIPMHMLIERAQTVSVLYQTDRTKALKRTQLIIAACNEHPSVLEHSSDRFAPSDDTDSDTNDDSTLSLCEIPFLPVLGRPEGYPLSWRGDSHQLMCGKDLTMPAVTTSDSINIQVSGSQVIFVNTGPVEEGGCGAISEDIIELLGIKLTPTVDDVILHFKEVIEHFSSQEPSGELVHRMDRMCHKIYEFLDNELEESDSDSNFNELEESDSDSNFNELEESDSDSNFNEHLKESDLEQTFVEELKALPCIWTGQQFITVSVVARDWTRDGPYLFQVPSSLSFRKKLSKALKIKEEFTLSDVQNVLAQMKDDFGDDPINEPSQEVFNKLVPLLEKSEAGEEVLMLPDEDFVMHPANELTFNDAPWAPRDTKYNYVHKHITRQVAIKFSVKLVRSEFLGKFVSSAKTHFHGVPFGQHEELTRRIQNILEGYPLDITVLKELLQNADDAKATKMYIIMDKRVHGHETILSEKWEKLQGPALLVWNDSVFSEEDLQGIQELGLGSKRSDAETIGQYGIGFNVVYHLTDCPSFITGGETMCVLDPHCRFVPGADVTDPGRRYDNLVSDGFWDTFKDMQSAYLRSGLDNCPSEVQKGGSLFRFPLRHTPELVRMSAIVKKDPKLQPKPLTADDMHANLKDWAPSMKEAMLFLNHVTELRFFVIEENSHSLLTLNNYRTKVDQSAQDSRVQLHRALSAFKEETGSKSSLVRYPLTVCTVTHKKGAEQLVEERWLIQQGVGDIENEQQNWKYIGNIKPRHGIAAPLELPPAATTSGESSTDKHNTISGQVFCFLPLPVESRLPVHINGHFVLDSNRRELWHSTDPNREDDKSAWNRKIFQAIASSYTSFLEQVQRYYVTKEQYKSYHDAFDALAKYYAIFPKSFTNKLDGQYLSLAETVYLKLVAHNSSVLAVVYQDDTKKPKIKWSPIKSENPSSQVHFWSVTSYAEGTPEYEKKHIKPLLEAMGMQLTAAPSRIQNHLNKAITDKEAKIQETKPATVYTYYQQFSEQAITTESATFPCPIDSTIFKRAEVFKRFTEYLLGGGGEFPDSKPFGHPLLLTADSILRRFDESHKVLVSDYSSLFQEKLYLFLHPKLLKVSYSRGYFAQDSDYEALVVDILTAELPVQLSTSRVLGYDEHITQERLKSLWECFSKDHAFSSELDVILKQWALIPTSGGNLYSKSSKLLPVYPPNRAQGTDVDIPSSTETVYQVLSTLNMPFIDTSLIVGCSLSCPLISDSVEILKDLYFLSLDVEFSDLLTKEMVKVLLSHVKSIDFRNDADSLQYIKSLPLFENVDGKFSSIQGKTTYKWHYSTNTAGYSEWIKHFDVIFLHYRGDWKSIGTEQLQIASISAEKIYSQYIFRVFDSMSEKERYEHLEHIRDVLFGTNKANSKKYMSERDYDTYSQACTFISGLERLPCIGADDEVLRPVSDFCDHTLSIFKVFKRQYRFLPDFFTKEDKVWSRWYGFFVQLNLRQTVSKKEFLHLCHLNADSHEDPERGSRVLLDFFFSTEVAEEGWYKDSYLVREVSTIPFVPAEQLPKLSWIKSPYRPTNVGRRIVKENELIELTKLSGAAFTDDSDCLWTVKPIVKLPIGYLSREKKNLLLQMSVSIEVTLQNVLDNIKNISSLRKFTDFKLFDNYPASSEPSKDAISLRDVMRSQLSFLQGQLSALSDSSRSVLKDTPCIPVPTTADKSHIHAWKVVLVKPCLIINGDTQDLHPFLHSVPKELETYLGLLQNIGVCNSIALKHCQMVLELIYKHSDEQKLDENSKVHVRVALKHLKQLLTKSRDCSQELTPLYLPSDEGKLVLSTTLLYPDSSSFLGPTRNNIQDQRYSLISLVPNYEYGFSEKDFCDALPETVKPKGMSEVCDQKILEEFKVPLTPSDSHIKLEKTLSMKDELPNAINAVVRHQAKDHKKSADIKDLFREFIASIRIFTVKKVRTIITLKETGALIGRLDLDFHLQYEQHDSTEQLCLYIRTKPDQESDEYLVDSVIRALSRKLIGIIKQKYPDLEEISYSKISEILGTLLRLQTPSDLEKALKQESISYKHSYSNKMEEITIELGKEVPADWHHRLDQSIDNVFHPGELVGYEIQEDYIVFARIMHPVLPEDGSLDSVQHVNMRYRIYTSLEDDEGTEVGILRLYKFLRGLKPTKKLNEDERGLVLFEGETEPARLQKKLREEDLEKIIEGLKKQLNEIWKLPEEERKRAIRRLYLKWHPDKNPDNPDLAEKVFKFLNSEVDKRMRGGIYRDDLDATARRHRNNFYRERQYSRQSHGYPSGSSEGSGGFGSSGWGASPDHDDPFAGQDLQPEPDPEEGKRWLKQAEANFDSLTVLFEAAGHRPRVCGDVCFMAHQVAEKALKGGKYFVCGLDSNSLRFPNLSTHAYGLQSERPGETHGLAAHTTPLEQYYLEPRYPNRWPPGVVPADRYTYQQAEAAKNHAQAILDIIKNIIQEE